MRRQLAGILATQPNEDFVDSVFDRSDGNAFFVEELVASRESGCRTGLTESLRDLLLVRVEVLPDEAQRVVRIVAEGGSTVEYPLLRAVVGLGEDALIEALRAAVGANILLATPDGDGYRFRHSLVREAVSDDLLPGERARVNRRYAEAMEADDSLIRAEERVIRLASYWYHANDPSKALPAVLSASVAARRRHAYSEQLRLLERALDLWDSAPEEVREELRPADYSDVYPPCGCDPATTPLQRLDLLAEATVAARYGGERERALKFCKTAVRMLDDGHDPLRAAWFWTERSRLVASLGRGDGWDEIAKAQELVQGLPPSQVHAEVLVRAAGWGMLHDPGPGNIIAAERAVEYARMVGAEDIELNARITVGCLLTDSGDPERGLAEMHAVRERATELGLTLLAGRAHINLTSQLEGMGRSREAVELAERGAELVKKSRLLDSEAWLRGNMAESLYSLGRWDEAAAAAQRTLLVGQSAAPRGSGASRLSYLALARGELTEAAQQLAAAHTHFGDHDMQPQHRIPLYRLAVGVAAGRAGSPTSAPRRPPPSPTGSRSDSTATPGRCCSPPPVRRRTPGDCPPPTRTGTPPWTSCARPPAVSPPPPRCGAPTPSTSAPSCSAPRPGTPSPTGPPWRRPSARWNARTCWPAPATSSPRRCWPPAATASPPPPCSARPTPPLTGSAHVGCARIWPCSRSAPGSRSPPPTRPWPIPHPRQTRSRRSA